jgi:hypothetical protein
MRKVLIMLLASGCCGWMVQAGFSQAGKPEQSFSEPVGKVEAGLEGKQGVDCKDPQAIRDFKDVVMGKLTGTGPEGRKAAVQWSACICGEAAGQAGFNQIPPSNPNSVPSAPRCQNVWPKEKCARVQADEYFKVYLPVSDRQSFQLGRCTMGLATGPAPASGIKKKRKTNKKQISTAP